MKHLLCTCLLGVSVAALAEEPPLRIPVLALGSAPQVDGDLGDWGGGEWTKVPIGPALSKASRTKYNLDPEEDRNLTGSLQVQIKAGVFGDRFYTAFKYPDSTEDASLRQWEWRGEKYTETKRRDDMFALRFHMNGDFDRSMLSTSNYTADVWLWSASRTNPAGLAEDMMHLVTTKVLENAAEYESPDKKTIYIKKTRDTGNPIYKTLPKSKEHKGDKIPMFEVGTATGSTADVAAKGRWKAGHWQLEFGRALSTGNADDVVFKPGTTLLGQMAVFNQGYSEHKSVSEPLLFDFSKLK